MFFGHPLVPAVEHLQPFCLPLPQHLSGDLFSTVEIEDSVTDENIFSSKLTMAIVYRVTSLYLWQGNPVMRGGGTVAHLFLVHTGNLTSVKTVEHLPTAAKHKENRKLRKNFPLVRFPTTSHTKLTPISHSLQSWRLELPYCHTFPSWSTKHTPGKQI